MTFTPVAFIAFMLGGSQLITGVVSEGISKTECNATKGCFFQPANCDPMHDCNFAMAYRPTQNGSVAFELSALINSDPTAQADYVAVGFSHDQQMGKDAVTQCVIDRTGKVKVSLSYNPGKSNGPIADGQKLDDEMISQVSGSSENVAGKNLLTCRFEQKVRSTVDDGSHVYDLSTPLYVLLASGRADATTKSAYKHTTNRADPTFPVVSPVLLTLGKIGSEPGPAPERNNQVDNHGEHAGHTAGIPEPEVFSKNFTVGPPHSEPERNGNGIGGAQLHQQQDNHNNSAYSLFASGTAVVFASILSQIIV